MPPVTKFKNVQVWWGNTQHLVWLNSNTIAKLAPWLYADNVSPKHIATEFLPIVQAVAMPYMGEQFVDFHYMMLEDPALSDGETYTRVMEPKDKSQYAETTVYMKAHLFRPGKSTHHFVMELRPPDHEDEHLLPVSDTWNIFKFVVSKKIWLYSINALRLGLQTITHYRKNAAVDMTRQISPTGDFVETYYGKSHNITCQAFFNRSSQLHNLDGPAFEYHTNAYDFWMWCQNDKLHRVDGPAVVQRSASGREAHTYYINGIPHNAYDVSVHIVAPDKPAINKYALDGKIVNHDQWLVSHKAQKAQDYINMIGHDSFVL